jgi:Protein of unknown function (DUF3467)
MTDENDIPDQEQKAPPVPQFNIVEVTHDLPVVYANGAFVQLGNNDGHLTFVLDCMEDPQTIRRTRQVRVVATPLLMKALYNHLGHALAQYEQIMGSIGGQPPAPAFDPAAQGLN